MFYQLRKTLDRQLSTVNNITIRPHAYKSIKFVIAIVNDKFLEKGFTRLNTRAGNLLTIKIKFATPCLGGAVAAKRVANVMHMVLRSDHVLEIHETKIRVFDKSLI